MGDPYGIGPEVLVKALADRALRHAARFVILGFRDSLDTAATSAGIEPYWWKLRAGSGLLDTTAVHDVVLLDYQDDAVGDWARIDENPQACKSAGEWSFRFVDQAISAAKGDHKDGLRADAIVTAPISKEAWALAGKAKWPGHTELLIERFGARRARMMFFSSVLRVALVTTHIPLPSVGEVLTIGRVFDTIDIAATGCRMIGITSPRIAVCGLNPHAGERGLMGDEEQRIITPAINMAREQGIDASGPFPGDTIFRSAVRGKYDAVVAMYHDQGLIPLKLLAFESAVNATIGLPVIRTSPDHGTAFDIAGKNLADPGSMRAALELAITMSAHHTTKATAINPPS